MSAAAIVREEEQIEDALAQNSEILKPFGYDLELYEDHETGTSGRQLVCKGDGHCGMDR